MSRTSTSTNPSPRSRAVQRGGIAGYAVGIVAMVAVAYANGFPEVFSGLDAKESIRDNPYIRSLWPLSDAMSLGLLDDTLTADAGSKGGTLVRRPLLSLTFALNHAVLGAEPWGYHLVNILIHAAAALVLFGLVRRTLLLVGGELRYAASAASLAAATAILWAVHPLHTESVTNLVQRAESLMGFLYLLTLYGVARAATDPGRRHLWSALAVGACAAGMGTKETMVTAPVAALLYHWVFVSRAGRDLRTPWSLYAALMATWAVLAALLWFTAEDAARDFAEGKTLPYVLAQPRVILHYIRLALWPDPLHVYVNTDAFSFVPGVTPIRAFILPALGIAFVLTVGVLAAIRRNGIGFLIVSFFLLLAPTSSIVATSDVLQEHRMYLSLACLVAAVVIGADRVLGARRAAGLVLLAVTTLALVARTHARNGDYHSEFGMVYPGDLRAALVIVARHEFHQGRIDLALELFGNAFAQLPDDHARAEAHYDLGNLFLQHGRMAEAHQQFQEALRANPALAAAHNNLGVLHAVQGDSAAAEHHLRAAIEFNPRHYLAMTSLALILAAEGRDGEAIGWLETVEAALAGVEFARKPLLALRARAADQSLPRVEPDLTVHLFASYSDAYLRPKLRPAHELHP